MKYKKYSDEWFLDQYFKYGSVEEVLRSSEDYLPISPTTFHRKIKSNGLVGSAGKQASFPEVLHFFRLKAMEPGAPIEKIYRIMPRHFQTSLVTLHRIYHAIEKQIIRREATILLISHPDDKYMILVGEEATANLRYSKNIGDISVPTGFSKKDEVNKRSVLRVLQEEFSVDLAINKSLENYFDLTNIQPFMYFDIVDVRVKIFHLVCPKKLASLSKCHSYKLTNHQFIDIDALINKKNLRVGAAEIIKGYKNYLNGNLQARLISDLNYQITNMESNPKLALHYQI